MLTFLARLAGHCGGVWGRLAHLGASWGVLGASWGVLGASWGVLGPSWPVLGPSWGRLGAVLGRLGAVLGPSWAPGCRQRATGRGLGGPGEG